MRWTTLQTELLLQRCAFVEIDHEQGLNIVVFASPDIPHLRSIETVEIIKEFSPVLMERVKRYKRKALLLNPAPPIAPIEEITDPILGQTKYMMTFEHVSQDFKIESTRLDKPLTER